MNDSPDVQRESVLGELEAENQEHPSRDQQLEDEEREAAREYSAGEEG